MLGESLFVPTDQPVMSWLSIALVFAAALLIFALARRLPAKWRLALGTPLLLLALYGLAAEGQYVALALLVAISAVFATQLVRRERAEAA